MLDWTTAPSPDADKTLTLDPAPVAAVRHQRAVGSVSATFGCAGTDRDNPPTRIRRLSQAGCLKLRFPRLPGAAAEAVIVNTAGGLAGGDRLAQRFDVADGADLRVTTQACERVYRALGDEAGVETALAVGAGASLAYLPQETILFDGGRLRRSLRIDCASSSRFLAAEAVILGRRAMGETVRHGRLRDRWRIRRDGRLVLAEDLDLEPGSAGIRGSPAALGGHSAFATLVWQDEPPERGVRALRVLFDRPGVSLGGASTVDGLGIARIAAPTGYELRRLLVPALVALAPGGLPRVWSL